MKKIIKRITLLILIYCLCSCSSPTSNMSEEEFRVYRKSYIEEYEVCSVMQYINYRTNGYGGIVGTDLCYAFTYLDSDGNLHTIDEFEHWECGTTKVCVGDANKYIIDSYGAQKEYLYLTKETLGSLNIIKRGND